jgi:hypothetical protein
MHRGETAATFRGKVVSVPQEFTDVKSPKGKLVEEELYIFTN